LETNIVYGKAKEEGRVQENKLTPWKEIVD
jgi:hypothetical protein